MIAAYSCTSIDRPLNKKNPAEDLSSVGLILVSQMVFFFLFRSLSGQQGLRTIF